MTTFSGQIYPLASTVPDFQYRLPNDWLTLPYLGAEGEEKFAGIYAVYDTQSNFIAVNFEGDYTVDWGDGVIENVASGVTAEHTYNFSTLPEANLVAGGYKQVLVTVEPQAGFQITAVDLDVRHSIFSTFDIVAPWKAIAINAPNLSSILLVDSNYLYSLEYAQIGSLGNCTDASYLFYDCSVLKRVTIESMPLVESLYDMFDYCFTLDYVHIPDCPNITEVDYIFYDCYSLREVYIGDISNAGYADDLFDNYDYGLEKVYLKKIAGDCSSVFEDCYSLKEVTIEDPSLITDATYMFYSCYNLENMYLKATPLLTSTYQMFVYCFSLRNVVFEDLSAVTEADYMFEDCPLEEVSLPLMNLLSSADGMFSGCYILKNVQLADLGSSSLEDVFRDCFSLEKVTLSGELISSSMISSFHSCSSLTDVQVEGSPSYWDGAFTECSSLRSLIINDASNLGDFSGGSLLTNFESCGGLSNLRLPGMLSSFSVQDCMLSRDALVQLFQDLGTPLASTDIYIQGNPGVSELSPTDYQIATDKNWNVDTFTP